MEFLQNYLVTYAQYLLENFAVILVIVVVGNLLIGAMAAYRKKQFEMSVALDSIVNMLFLFVSYALVGLFAFSLKGVTAKDLELFSLAFATLTILIIVYKGNSMLLSFVTVSRIPMPKMMYTLDAKVKEMFNREEVATDMEYIAEQAFLLKQEEDAADQTLASIPTYD